VNKSALLLVPLRSNHGVVQKFSRHGSSTGFGVRRNAEKVEMERKSRLFCDLPKLEKGCVLSL